MSTKPVDVGSLKKGSFVIMDGAACVVADVQISKSGKHGHAKVRFTGVGITDEKKRVMISPAHDTIEVPIIEKKNAQVLSVLGESANVMDAETYETFDLKIPPELKEKVREGATVLYWVIMGDKVMKQVQSGA
ncbi:translation initiation factor IF-5A [Candidatus Woesearchaeota archaeon]|nr:translation initiation factor IF-5A [Candidatus Woesearchaeota archaeon]